MKQTKENWEIKCVIFSSSEIMPMVWTIMVTVERKKMKFNMSEGLIEPGQWFEIRQVQGRGKN